MWCDPETQIPFYIGKGKGQRAFNNHAGQRCYNKLKKIIDRGNSIKDIVTILVEDLTETDALIIEEEYIARYKRIEDGGTLFNYKTSDKGGGGKFIDPAINIQITKLYTEERLSALEIGKILNLNESTVLRRLKMMNIQVFPRGSRFKFTPNEISDMVNLYNSGMSAIKLSKKYKCSIPTILTILRKEGCCIKTKQQIKQEKLNSVSVQTQ